MAERLGPSAYSVGDTGGSHGDQMHGCNCKGKCSGHGCGGGMKHGVSMNWVTKHTESGVRKTSATHAERFQDRTAKNSVAALRVGKSATARKLAMASSTAKSGWDRWHAKKGK